MKPVLDERLDRVLQVPESVVEVVDVIPVQRFEPFAPPISPVLPPERAVDGVVLVRVWLRNGESSTVHCHRWRGAVDIDIESEKAKPPERRNPMILASEPSSSSGDCGCQFVGPLEVVGQNPVTVFHQIKGGRILAVCIHRTEHRRHGNRRFPTQQPTEVGLGPEVRRRNRRTDLQNSLDARSTVVRGDTVHSVGPRRDGLDAFDGPSRFDALDHFVDTVSPQLVVHPFGRAAPRDKKITVRPEVSVDHGTDGVIPVSAFSVSPDEPRVGGRHNERSFGVRPDGLGMPTDQSITDEHIRGLVSELKPGWRVTEHQRIDHGTDFLASLRVDTPDGEQRVVLKAATADHVPPSAARLEPRFMRLVASEMRVPVPTVYAICDTHDTSPTPCFLMGAVDGENYENRVAELPFETQARIVSAAGRYIAAINELGSAAGIGRLGYRGGEIRPVEETAGDLLDHTLDSAEETLSTLDSGGFFPDLAQEPERFADLVAPLRSYLRETIPELPEPDPPRYCHADYRYGNLLADPDTGETTAVLDWGLVSDQEPAHNIAFTECALLDRQRDGEERTAELRSLFRDAYSERRGGWAFDDCRRERMAVYRLVYRISEMACFPLWYSESSERAAREQRIRAFVDQSL